MPPLFILTGMRTFFLFHLVLYSFMSVGQMTPTYEVQVPMRDNKFLAADVYVPSGCNSCPTILIQTPYNKNDFRFGLPLFTLQNVNNSPFSWVVADWRGFYGSASAVVAQPNRGQDGYDIIEWITEQSWNNGKVGTWGPSALGGVQYQTAKENHPSHVCAVPIVAHPQQSYDSYFYGGVLEKTRLNQLDALGYGLSAGVLSNVYYNNTWAFLENSTWYPSAIKIPMLQIGGWYDHNIDKMVDWYKATRQFADISVRDKQWLLVGPWVHGGTGSATVGSANQGELTFTDAAYQNNYKALDFFNFYLLNIENGWEQTPLVNRYNTQNNEWLSGDDANFELTEHSEMFFNPNNALSVDVGDGFSSFTVDPANAAPTISGQTLTPLAEQGPYSLDELDIRNDVLVFESSMLLSDFFISGRTEANLYVQCNRADADIVIRLADVFPDGRSILVNDGIKRLRFRNGYTLADESFVNPTDVNLVNVRLPFINYTFKAGHKIKVYVGGNSAQRWDINLQNGSTMYVSGDTLMADIQLFHSDQYPSSIKLPGNQLSVNTSDIPISGNQFYFPNPVEDELIVPDRYKNYEIYDLNGLLVTKGAITNSKIELNGISKSVYILHLVDELKNIKRLKFFRSL